MDFGIIIVVLGLVGGAVYFFLEKEKEKKEAKKLEELRKKRDQKRQASSKKKAEDENKRRQELESPVPITPPPNSTPAVAAPPKEKETNAPWWDSPPKPHQEPERPDVLADPLPRMPYEEPADIPMDDPLHDHVATVVDEPTHAADETNDGEDDNLSLTEQATPVDSSTSGGNDVSSIFETVEPAVELVSQTSEDSAIAATQSLDDLVGTMGSPTTQVTEPKAAETEVVSAFAPRFVELPVEPVVEGTLGNGASNVVESIQEVKLPVITTPTQEQGQSNEEFLAALVDSTENFSIASSAEQAGLSTIDENGDRRPEASAGLQGDEGQAHTSSLESDVDDLVERIVDAPPAATASESTALDDENLTLTGVESGQVLEEKPTVDFSGIEKALPANPTAELLGLMDRQEDIAFSPALGQSLEGLFGSEPIFPPTPAEPTKKRLDRKARILVVDDARVVRIKMSAVLTDAGFDLIQAVDGKQALDILLSEVGMGVDMVLSDIEMPNMNGLELFERLKANPDLSQIPFAVVTGNYENIEAATRLGCVYALLKPFSDEDVENLVASCLSTVYEGFDR